MLWGGVGGWDMSPPGNRLPAQPFGEGGLLGRGLGRPLQIPLLSPSSQEPSPYDESEVHDSFHQLILEQSRWAAEEGLELQRREPGTGALGDSGEPARPGWDGVARKDPEPSPALRKSLPAAWGGGGASSQRCPCRLQTSLSGLAGSDRQALLGPEDAPAHSTATLRILASMPSRTIGE